MTYLEKMTVLKARLEAMDSPARLDLPYQQGRAPTQAFSEFLTNKEQGDWAEKTFIENFNRSQNELWAVKYGRSEDLVAGEEGFDDHYRVYQEELKEIGKRPDLLVFPRVAVRERLGEDADVSNISRPELDQLVPKAVAAIEVRSSAFLSGKYDLVALRIRQDTEAAIIASATQLLNSFREEIAFSDPWRHYLEDVVENGVDPSQESPRALGRKSTARLAACRTLGVDSENRPQRGQFLPDLQAHSPAMGQKDGEKWTAAVDLQPTIPKSDRLLEAASALTKGINEGLKRLRQRDFLSITPKAEDLSQVYRWVQKYGVPHHYCQVFFDRAIILSFEDILSILCDPARENADFFIESDEKNQGKVTFKINVQLGRQIMDKVELPMHSSAMKELPKGRLLFYVRFETSRANVATPVL